MPNDEPQRAADSAHISEPAVFAIAWSPEVLSSTEYARLVGILGDLVRASGARGVERVRSQMVGGTVGSIVLV
jgi:hypothetical protein